VDSALLTGLGLAAPAGLNAYLPLLILALADRFSNEVTLERPYDFLSSTWGIVILTLLLTLEVVVDKVPGADHANDLIQSVIRPAAGGVLAMAATNDAVSINPVVAMILGLLVAGSVHAAKATTRPAVTLATGGIGNPLVSVVEDVVAAATAIVAIFVPLLVLLFLALFVLFLVWAFRRLRRPGGPVLTDSASSTLRR
jgi:hypothetical protein